MRVCGVLVLLAAWSHACSAQQPRLEDGAGMQFVHIPAGEFWMGSDATPEALGATFTGHDAARLSKFQDEGPVHRVRITRSFWMGRHEVTVGQFRRFLRESGHVPESIADGTGGYGFDAARARDPSYSGDAFAGRDFRYSWSDPGFAQGDDHPVVNVTWFDAVAMARWLSATQHATYRLPTEAEWEYAARAGTRTHFHAGDDPQTLLAHANVFDRDAARYWPRWSPHALEGSDGFAFTSPVGRFASNAFGLHDMHGNVWEWCADWHGDDYYARSPLDDPQGPDTGSVRVRRGGSWHTWALYARAAFRNWNAPGTRYTLVGFRLVREVSEGEGAKGPAVRPTAIEPPRLQCPGVTC